MADYTQQLGDIIGRLLNGHVISHNDQKGIVIYVGGDYVLLHDGREIETSDIVVWSGAFSRDFVISEEAMTILTERHLVQEWHKQYVAMTPDLAC